jgi:hypothetical protein
MMKKIGQKRKGDYMKIELDDKDFLEKNMMNGEEEKKEKETRYKKISPLKMEYDFKGSYRIGFEEKQIDEDDK